MPPTTVASPLLYLTGGSTPWPWVWEIRSWGTKQNSSVECKPTLRYFNTIHTHTHTYTIDNNRQNSVMKKKKLFQQLKKTSYAPVAGGIKVG